MGDLTRPESAAAVLEGVGRVYFAMSKRMTGADRVGASTWSGEELGAFLRARRAAMTPERAGIRTYGSPRRVAGLRREEVAELAGLSTNYYARIEQGKDHRMSDAVIESIARALQLDRAERIYLLRLARPRPIELPNSESEAVRPSILALIQSMTDRAAFLLNHRMDLLGFNSLGAALHGLRPGQRPNAARMLFLNPATRNLLPDWDADARKMTSEIRMTSSKYPDDSSLTEVINELHITSADFRRMWDQHEVSEFGPAIRQYDHPLVGHMVLSEESLFLPDGTGRRLVLSSAEPGSGSRNRLEELTALAARAKRWRTGGAA